MASVDTNVTGTYTILYEVSDNAGQVATPVQRTVTVSDTTAPVITLIGNSADIVECTTVYADPGATATDGCDGDLTVVVDGTVDTSVPGVHTINYDVQDSAGNVAVTVTRTVTVIDSVIPVITLLGSASTTVECGAEYVDAGAAVADDCDSTVEVVTSGTVNTAVAGVLYPPLQWRPTRRAMGPRKCSVLSRWWIRPCRSSR